MKMNLHTTWECIPKFTSFPHPPNLGVAWPNEINAVSHRAVMDADCLTGLLCVPKTFFVYLFFWLWKNTCTLERIERTLSRAVEIEIGDSIWGEKCEKRQGKVTNFECLSCVWHFLGNSFNQIPCKWEKTRLREKCSMELVELWIELSLLISKHRLFSLYYYTVSVHGGQHGIADRLKEPWLNWTPQGKAQRFKCLNNGFPPQSSPCLHH